jgi:3-phosphoshikimate 1-carboxyvinyltransferase
MIVTIQPSEISGNISAPASKSAMQRACAAALIKGGRTVLQNAGNSADDRAAIDIITQLGAKLSWIEDSLIIESRGIEPISQTIDCGESGLSVRMFTSIAATLDQPITVTGSGSLLKRPLSFFDEVFPALGIRCKSENGFLPLKIQGPLQPANIEIDGSLSSQFLTGLLFAYAAAGASDKTISVKNLNSKPYIDLTLQVMADFGLTTPVNSNFQQFYFPKASITQFSNDTIHYTVEADWSGGAFLLVAGAIAGKIILKGLDVFSTQADKAVLEPLMQTNAFLSIQQEMIEISPNHLMPFHFDATDCPDLFPPLVALASCCEGSSVIEGVQRLTHKESNRALTLQQEFAKMGVEIKLQDDLMIISREGELRGAVVDSHHDHRIAMACAVAALRAKGETTIVGAEAVNKSYPQFWDHLKQLKVDLSLNKQ